jgi:hypothetical protein
MDKRFNWKITACAICCAVSFIAPAMVNAAENLRLAPGVSFVSDIGTSFPIVGDKMNDFTVQPGRPTLIFFGAPGDLNTNRQAKRLVQLYAKHHDDTKFIIVNVDNPDPSARELIKKYYPGYVPAQLLMNKQGHTVWSQVGEISRKKLGGQINQM